jgi:hypothetical protein
LQEHRLDCSAFIGNGGRLGRIEVRRQHLNGVCRNCLAAESTSAGQRQHTGLEWLEWLKWIDMNVDVRSSLTHTHDDRLSFSNRHVVRSIGT